MACNGDARKIDDSTFQLSADTTDRILEEARRTLGVEVGAVMTLVMGTDGSAVLGADNRVEPLEEPPIGQVTRVFGVDTIMVKGSCGSVTNVRDSKGSHYAGWEGFPDFLC